MEKSRDRESLFNEFVLELRKKEKEERAERAKRARKDFFALLRENSSSIDRHSHWSDVKKQVHEMPVYEAGYWEKTQFNRMGIELLAKLQVLQLTANIISPAEDFNGASNPLSMLEFMFACSSKGFCLYIYIYI